MIRKCLFFIAAFFIAANSHAAFIVAVDLDPVDGPQSLNPNFSFGGDTTSASDSAASAAVGLPDHNSLFGGNGATGPDTYIATYTPGTDVDNFSPAGGSLLGSVTGFGTEIASGAPGGGSGAYNVYITSPASTNISGGPSLVSVTGDGGTATFSADLNNAGTGADLDPDAPFVGGANNAWLKVATVDLTAGNTYSVTLTPTDNTFVSQRLAGVMWEAVPEPNGLAIASVALIGLLAFVRKR